VEKSFSFDPAASRAFLFGEAFFTTMLYKDGRFLFLEDHWQRISKSWCYLFSADQIHTVLDLWAEKLELTLQQLQESSKRKAICRFTFSMDTEGSSLFSVGGTPSIEIKIRDYPSIASEYLDVQLSFQKKCPKTLIPSFFKKTFYLDSILEKRQASSQGWDDVVFLDTSDNFAEATTSNIFFIKGSTLVTPKLSSCVLDGITRRKIIESAEEIGLLVDVRNIHKSEADSFEFGFLSNSIKKSVPIRKMGVDASHFEFSHFSEIYNSIVTQHDKKIDNYVRESEKVDRQMRSLQEEI